MITNEIDIDQFEIHKQLNIFTLLVYTVSSSMRTKSIWSKIFNCKLDIKKKIIE